MESPFLSPDEARRLAVPHILKAAEQINPLLAAGQRVFHVPIGLGTPLQDAISEKGWSVEQRPYAADPDSQVSLVVSEP